MYSFKNIEESALKFWEKNKIYEKTKKKNKKGKKFYFLQGPPYTSGRLHVGQAWNNALKDIVLRYKRMNGFRVWDRAGYDMHGLPTENAVQKKFNIKDKQEIEKFGVENFIKECINFSIEKADLMSKDLWRLGVWMDYKNAYLPIKNEFIEGEWWLIKKAWEQGRLYKGKKIMHWCSTCETSLAKHELEYKNIKDKSIFLKFKLKDKNEYLIIWTTTPWTIPFNLAIMANPDLDYARCEVESENKEIWILAKSLADTFLSKTLGKKYKILEEFKGKKLEGLKYLHPLYNDLKEVYEKMDREWNIHRVILSKEYVDDKFGSGLVHAAPGCGPEDYEVCKKYGIGSFNEIDERGYFKGMGKFSNLRAKEDDKVFIEILKENGSLIKSMDVEHEYAHCWRCHNPVVFRATEQWFMKIEDLLEKLIEFNKEVHWIPNFCKNNYDIWTKNLKDNGITRQRYWGCPAPIWQCDCGEVEVIGSIKELKKKSKNIPENLHKPWIDDVKFKCRKCKGEMRRIPDIIDVWIDSGTTSWNCLYYPKTKKYFDLFPADLVLEATEQVRLWFSMLQICSAIALNSSSYKNVYCHGMILDYQGMKMSKSLGNIISPYEIIDKYGADVLRYYICETPAGENINFNWEDVKIKQGNLNILYNIFNFLKELKGLTRKNKKLSIEEKYILSRKNKTVMKVTELMDNYKIDEIIREIENLFLDLSRVYIKFTREAVNSGNSGKVLYTVLDVYIDIIKMFSIICPFITEEIWQLLRKEKLVKEESVHLSSWPAYKKELINEKLEEDFGLALEIIKKGLSIRDKLQIGLKWPLPKAFVSINKNLSEDIKELIKNQLNVKSIELKILDTKEVSIELDSNLSFELEAEGYAREIVRKIQFARKNFGFVKKDKIHLEIIVDEEIKKFIETQKDFIKKRVNAKKVFVKLSEDKVYKCRYEDKIKNKKIVVLFEKVG